MQEATSFLRYVLPGLISIVEFLGYILISGDPSPGRIGEWTKDTGLVAGAFLASAALGALWGVIYYQVVDCIDRLKINYSLPFEEAQSRKWVKLECYRQGRELQGTKLTEKGAWRVGGSYFSTRAEVSKSIKGADRRMNRFADLVHGLGATWVGSFMALVFFLIVNISRAWPSHQVSGRALLSLVTAVVILILHFCNFMRVKKECEIVYRMILLEEFEIRYEKKKEPIRFYVSQDDLKREKNKSQSTCQESS